MSKKGPALKAPKAKIFAVLKEAEADAAADEGSLKPGAEARSADGAGVIGKVTALTPHCAVLTTGEGNIPMPLAALLISDQGSAVNVTQELFVAGRRGRAY